MIRLNKHHDGHVSAQPGFTLIEVLAAIVILGGAVTTMVVAQAVGVRRMNEARWELEAREMAHELIAQWRLEETDMAVDASGRFAEEPGWFWRRSVEPHRIGSRPIATMVTLEVGRSGPGDGSAIWLRKYVWLTRAEKDG